MSKEGAHLFRNPSLFSILTQDARTAGMVGDPNLLKAVVALQNRPELYDQFLRQDPRLSTVLEVLLDRSEKPQVVALPPSSMVAPAFRPTEHLWQLLRNGSEDEVRVAISALGRNAPFLRELGPRGMTPLMEAAVRRRKGERLVAALLQQGAPVHMPGAQNRTALHWAAAGGNAPAARALIDAGANVSVRDEAETTPLDLALTGAHEEVAALLIDAMERASRSATPAPSARISQSNDSSPSPLRASSSPAPLLMSMAPISVSSAPSSPLVAASAPRSAPASPPVAPASTFSSASVSSAATLPSAPTTAINSAAPAPPRPSTSSTGGDEELIEQLVELERRVAELESTVAARDKKISAMEEDTMCSVCMERPVDTVILECAHAVLCVKCGSAPLKTCPVCSKPIVRIIRTYRA